MKRSRFFILIIVFSLILFISPLSSNAAAITVIKTSELSIGGLKPNQPITEEIKRFSKAYKVSVDSMMDQGTNSYITGDPTAAMSWFMSLSPDKEGRLVNVDYEQFKKESKGIPNANIKGIKVGSGINSVYKIFGSNKYIKRSRSLPYYYLELPYVLKLKETGQKIKLTFSLRYSKGQKESQAIVYGLQYELLESLKTVPKEPDTSEIGSGPLYGGTTQGAFNGKTIKVGMTKSQVLELLGKPVDIKTPFGRTIEERKLMEQNLGTDHYRSSFIEQWIYHNGSYDALVLLFSYKEKVREVFDYYE